MAFKPNYNQQRAERNRAKEQKSQIKQQRREEKVAQRKPPTDGQPQKAEKPEES